MLFRGTAAFSVLVLVLTLTLVPVATGEDVLTADFIAHDSFTNGFTPFTIQFEDRSPLAASRVWNFGEGQTSMVSEPTHTYANPGTCTVSLTIHDTTGTQANTKMIPDYIIVAEDPLHTATTTTPVPTTTKVSPVPVATTSYPAYSTTMISSTTATPARIGFVSVTSLLTGSMVSIDNVEAGHHPPKRSIISLLGGIPLRSMQWGMRIPQYGFLSSI
jgi:PKD repeat protein